MKKTLLYLFVALATLSKAQLTLTKAANEPVVGDQKGIVALDTSFYSGGMPNISGTNVLWDFTNLAVNPTVGVVSSDFIAAASATSTPPPGATLAEDQSGSYTFYKSVSTPSVQYELVSIKFGTIALTFTNTALIAQWPVSMGYNVTDNIAGSVQFSITANFTGTTNTLADGTGTLMMPQGNTFTNVLRLKSVQTMTITVSSFPVGNVKQTIYQYFAPGDKFPILTVNCSKITFGSQVQETSTAQGNSNHLAIGIKENQLNDINFTILPNPANTTVSVELEKNKVASSLTLINAVGQVVKRVSNSNSMSISEVAEGVYYLEVSSEGRSARRSLVINH